jgi:nitric oxide dioxygenase
MDKRTPVVLVSGGVGITPMISMLASLTQDHQARRIVFVHACRDASVHAFKDWVNQRVAAHGNLAKHIYYEAVGEGDVREVDYDAAGRVDLSLLVDDELAATADFYVCGPMPFMLAQKKTLENLGVDVSRIHTEVFGSGMLN